MAGTFSDESGVGSSSDGTSNAQQRCRASEEFAEWRSSEQVVNGTTSTSPLWDADDYDDCGPKPSELYGNFEWDIQNFSGIKKKELRSGVFRAGGYKWYVLIYPQGCDVCNHLSLFLCVANHDDLLPGWSHFAQFTILVTNKDPKKNKYSDTLHRFWKKEHDWGWKKFMEISKLVDGFTESDTLKIKAQVQIIRDRVDRPFRCLTTLYRRELVRIYLSHVDKMCCRFLEKIRMKVGGMIDDAPRWSRFCTYWREIDQKTRHNLARCKKDSQMFKAAIEELFKEKEVTSTLVMDSLYSGIKSLEGEIKNNKVKSKFFDDQTPMPIILDKDTFILVEDVVTLLEKAAVETLPPKDASCEEDIITERTIERYEKRLIEIGRKTIELIITDYIFRNKIELAFQETVALKNQEELLREEEQEAAWLAAGDRKAKRGAVGKESKSKKKTGKQKKSNRKGKDKVREVKPSEEEKRRQENRTSERKEFMSEVAEAETIDLSDMSDAGDCGIEDREYGPNNWDTDVSEIHHPLVEITTNGGGWKKSSSLRDDSSSTCSTDSVQSVVINVPNKVNSVSNMKPQKSSVRGWSRRVETSDDIQIQRPTSDDIQIQRLTSDDIQIHRQTSNDIQIQRQTSECVPANSQVAERKTQDVLLSLQDRVKRLEQHMVNKEEVSAERKLPLEDDVNTKTLLKKNPTELPSPKKLTPVIHQKPDAKMSSEPTSPLRINKPETVINKTQLTNTPATQPALTLKPKPIPKPTPQQVPPPAQTTPRPPAQQVLPPAQTTPRSPAHQVPPPVQTIPRSPAHQVPPPVQTTPRSPAQQVPPPVQTTPRSPAQQVPPPVPSEKPQIPATPTTQVAPAVSAVHSAPSSSTRLGPDPTQSSTSREGFDPSPSTHHYSGPQSVNPTARFVPAPSPSIYNNTQSYRSAMMTGNSVNTQPPYSQPLPLPGFFPSGSESSVRRGLTYGTMNNVQNLDMYTHTQQYNNPHDPYADDFPHIDIINELLDDGFQSHNMTSGYDAAGTSTGMWSYPQNNNTRAYLNERIPEQLQMNGSDLSYLSLLRNSEGAGYPYHVPASSAAAAGYLNLPYGVDGYSVYRP